MNLLADHRGRWIAAAVALVALVGVVATVVLRQRTPEAPVAAEGADAPVAGKCMTCHKEQSPGIYQQWRQSPHGEQGVTCLDCHRAEKTDPDAFEHEGALIATLVTPKDCARCHQREAEEVGRSHHATAGKILESQDAFLAHAIGGAPVAQAGCETCHGVKIKIDPAAPNKLSLETWPNSGIGRINPDGSSGSCTACHTRHSFDKAQARSPEACAKCHVGPDHPQKEIYETSKHGQAFFTHEEEMNLGADRWVVGVDYFEAPTCATCHMSATRTQAVTHDVGQRISWTLRPPVSKHQEKWEAKRDRMKEVCSACHAPTQVDGHYRMFDGVVNLYDEKFAKPATEIMDVVAKKKLLPNKGAFSNDLEWAYWELWHHEGRRARHGAAMMSPDYTWWNGIYEVGKNFYFWFLPEARKLNDPEVNAIIARVMADPMHQWFQKPKAEVTQAIRSGELQRIYAPFFRTDFAEKGAAAAPAPGSAAPTPGPQPR
jgi:hydroxylamine dehydrogenase